MALGAVIMLCAVAIIGVGYAAFNGNARTYNENNSVAAGDMTLSPNGADQTEKWGAISYNVAEAFDTYVYSDGTNDHVAFYYTDSTGAGDISLTTSNSDYGSAVTLYSKSLGSKAYTVTNKTGAAITALNFYITPSTDVGNAEFLYFAKISYTNSSSVTVDQYRMLTSAGEKTCPVSSISIADTSSLVITVELFVGYVKDVYIPDSYIGPALANPAEPGDYDQAAHLSVSEEPEGFADLDLGFRVHDATA